MTITRRDFLRTSAASAAGLATNSIQARSGGSNKSCIFLVLLGGPSQLDTWDPKPDAPSGVRGPFRSIQTRLPGVRFTELFPKTAAIADCLAVVRSMHHTAAPIHETGLQLLQTGMLAENGREHPHFGAILSAIDGEGSKSPVNVLLPGPIGFTGVSVGHGQSAGELGAEHEPLPVALGIEDDPMRGQYGRTDFGDDCLRAARLIERGTRFVTVNMFQTVYDTITWDSHAAGGSLHSELSHYPAIAASFDHAYTALLQDLRQRGLLDSTLVVATGEFGRTPFLNREGGRDHWANVWSMLMAGGGIRGGQVIGSSDALGGEPKDRPIDPEQFAATLRQILGFSAVGHSQTSIFG